MPGVSERKPLSLIHFIFDFYLMIYDPGSTGPLINYSNLKSLYVQKAYLKNKIRPFNRYQQHSYFTSILPSV